MSKEPGQVLWMELWGALGYTWETAPSDAKAAYARVEAAMRADERERCALILDAMQQEMDRGIGKPPEAYFALGKAKVAIRAAKEQPEAKKPDA